ncbi:MAG: DUF262 domain-containing HNH endonuclease family protein [Silvanigrellaceae bacterium]|nr:DUF262 domain-containing HNH endonuclease family protein [Silvanigrellaceae bacterium]
MNPQYSPTKDILTKLYALPFFQRAYKWEQKQLAELIEDFQRAFLENYQPTHSRKDVSRYSDYFIGSVITTESDVNSTDKERRLLIDGHQRLTSITLLLCFLQNCAKEEQEIDDLIKKYVCSLNYGERSFQIKAENDRKIAMEKIISNEAQSFSATPNYENLEDSAKNIIDRYLDIEQVIDENLKGELLPFFTDWITNKVFLIDIQSASEHQAHRIFVTMNDRGLHLSPLDMLKGNILAAISDDKMRSDALASWETIVAKAIPYGREEMATFIKSLLRAKYALTIRDKTSGEAQDFELIGDQYHKWALSNTNLNLNKSQDYFNFTTKTINKYFEIYKLILDNSEKFNQKYKHIYYNAKRNSTAQILPILSAISEVDTPQKIEEKISIISRYLDAYLTARQINKQEINYDSLKEPLFKLSKELRDQDTKKLNEIIEPLKKSALEEIKKVNTVTYGSHKTQTILFLLSRIADHLELESEYDSANGFAKYIDRKRSSYTYDVEHILADKFDDHKHDSSAGGSFASKREFTELRNNIGNLILLPRSKNQSYNALPYNDKIQYYKLDNILSKSLCKKFYERNPKWKKFLTDSKLEIKSVDDFKKIDIEERSNLYAEIAKKIWD